MVVRPEQPLDEARADLGRTEQCAEGHREREVGAPRLQEDHEVDDDARADAGRNRQHQREQHEDQALMRDDGAGRPRCLRRGSALLGLRSADSGGITAICSGSEISRCIPA